MFLSMRDSMFLINQLFFSVLDVLLFAVESKISNALGIEIELYEKIDKFV
jgi:hypothetical protein